MGFSIYYRSTRPVTPAEAEAIRKSAQSACAGRTWLGCEPVHFYSDQEDGHLLGSSKPNFLPNSDDAAGAAREGLPDGTTRDLLEVLCLLSREHSVDWDLSHDFAEVGTIQGGVCDRTTREQIEGFTELGDILRELGEEEIG
jgi:hypothetical protein